MATAPPEARDVLHADLIAAQQESSTGENFQCAQSRNNLWGIWCIFCTAHNLDFLLKNLEDPIPILQAFMHRYRDGRIATHGWLVLAQSVEDVA